MRGRHARCQADHFGKGPRGLVESTLLGQRHTQLGLRLGVVGVQRDRLAQRVDRRVGVALGPFDRGAVLVKTRVGGIDGDCRLDQVGRLGELPALVSQNTRQVQRMDVGRFGGEHVAIALCSLLQVAGLMQGVALLQDFQSGHDRSASRVFSSSATLRKTSPQCRLRAGETGASRRTRASRRAREKSANRASWRA